MQAEIELPETMPDDLSTNDLRPATAAEPDPLKFDLIEVRRYMARWIGRPS